MSLGQGFDLRREKAAVRGSLGQKWTTSTAPGKTWRKC